MTNILNVYTSNKNYLSTIIEIVNSIIAKKKIYICVAATHLIMECQKNPKLLSGVNKAALVTTDGMPLVWLSKIYGNKHATRVYGPILTIILSKVSEVKKFKVYILGGSKGQSKELSNNLKEIFPKLNIVGTSDTPIRPIPEKDNNKILNLINKSKADIVFVGLGCPTQELWMIKNRNKVNSSVLIGVGAAFDFITGNVKQAPSWIQNGGLEWLFRLIQEPKRLWKRYCILNTQFVILITKQLFKDFILRENNRE